MIIFLFLRLILMSSVVGLFMLIRIDNFLNVLTCRVAHFQPTPRTYADGRAENVEGTV
jgi:hypothetical protein